MKAYALTPAEMEVYKKTGEIPKTAKLIELSEEGLRRAMSPAAKSADRTMRLAEEGLSDSDKDHMTRKIRDFATELSTGPKTPEFVLQVMFSFALDLYAVGYATALAEAAACNPKVSIEIDTIRGELQAGTLSLRHGKTQSN